MAHDEDRRPKDQTDKGQRSKDKRPVHMTGGDAHGGQLASPNAQEEGNRASSGEGEINFNNPDYNIQHNVDDTEGLEEQLRDDDKSAGHLTPAAQRRKDEKRDTSEE